MGHMQNYFQSAGHSAVITVKSLSLQGGAQRRETWIFLWCVVQSVVQNKQYKHKSIKPTVCAKFINISLL